MSDKFRSADKVMFIVFPLIVLERIVEITTVLVALASVFECATGQSTGESNPRHCQSLLGTPESGLS